MNSCIYNGVVTHSRFKPVKHFLKYKTFSFFIDLDEIEKLDKNVKIFSYNKFNIFSFYDKDHGDRDGKNLKCNDNFFLTLNPFDEINKKNIIKNIKFTHPYFNSETLKHQKSLPSLQGKKRTWYCGSYFGYGFHEDGIKSTINLMKNFKI